MKRVYRFYYDGFLNLSSWGRRVWIIILIKLFIIFVLLRIFFFPDLLKRNFSNDNDRSDYIRDQMLNLK